MRTTCRVALTAYLISLESLPMFGTNHTNAEMVLGNFPTQTVSKNNGSPESVMLDFARDQSRDNITPPNNFERLIKPSIKPPQLQ